MIFSILSPDKQPNFHKNAYFALYTVSLTERVLVLPSNLLPYIKSFNICVFALSTTELSNEARWICVVISESCPIPSLITDIGMFLLLAMLAHEWRATYKD